MTKKKKEPAIEQKSDVTRQLETREGIPRIMSPDGEFTDSHSLDFETALQHFSKQHRPFALWNLDQWIGLRPGKVILVVADRPTYHFLKIQYLASIMAQMQSGIVIRSEPARDLNRYFTGTLADLVIHLMETSSSNGDGTLDYEGTWQNIMDCLLPSAIALVRLVAPAVSAQEHRTERHEHSRLCTLLLQQRPGYILLDRVLNLTSSYKRTWIQPLKETVHGLLECVRGHAPNAMTLWLERAPLDIARQKLLLRLSGTAHQVIAGKYDAVNEQVSLKALRLNDHPQCLLRGTHTHQQQGQRQQQVNGRNIPEDIIETLAQFTEKWHPSLKQGRRANARDIRDEVADAVFDAISKWGRLNQQQDRLHGQEEWRPKPRPLPSELVLETRGELFIQGGDPFG